MVSKSSAIALIDEGNALEEQGRIAEAMARYDAAVKTDPRCARAHLNRGNILLESKPEEARTAYELALACDPNYAAAHFNMGNLNYRAGEFERAVRNYQAAVAIRGDFAPAYVALGNALDGLGRTREAAESYERALALNPGYAEVHLNLGILAVAQRRHEEAVSRFRSALEIHPDLAAAHHALGKTLADLGDLDTAETSLRRALAIEPQSADFLCDLAMTLLLRDKGGEALELTIRALELEQTWTTRRAFAICVAHAPSMPDRPQIRTILTTAVTEAWGTLNEFFCSPALELIRRNQCIADCVQRANASWPARLPRAVLFGKEGLANLAADSLLHALLETTPITSLVFERFLTCARYGLLEAAASEPGPEGPDMAGLRFYTALARQCFINEYVFDWDDRERTAATACRARLLALMDAGAVIPPLLLLAAAAYFPLYGLPEAHRLLAHGSEAVDMILQEQLREPMQEKTLSAEVRQLTPITSGVSERVRAQYEQNPYPRWIKRRTDRAPLRFNQELRGLLPFAQFAPMPDDSAPQVLVAGCGTGSHSILVAHQFRGVRVLAVDLSLRSLGYALRKTRELGVTNIEYAQADILELGGIDRTFDIIASVGVLHHLEDPFQGWRILLSRLRPGGFMDLGFYSEIARTGIARLRELIAARGYAGTADEIRRFRHDPAVWDTSAELQNERNSADFYTTSACRDLLFHAQEHRLTLGQIESFLSETGLVFLGFELELRVLHEYRARFPEDSSCTNLRNWAHFEADHPQVFANMYRFWVQKPIRH